MTPQEHEEMKQLSKEVFGSSSKWRKLVEKGVSELWEREKEVMVPTRKGIEKKVFKEHKYVIKRLTVEEVKEEMLKIIVQRKELKATLDSSSTVEIKTGETVKLTDGSELRVGSSTQTE